MPARTQDAREARYNPIAWLRRTIEKWGLENWAKRYYGTYDGTVIDDQDPEGRYRVRATCPAIGLVDDADVPDNFWISPTFPGCGVDIETGIQSGMIWTPDVGTNIRIQFKFGDTAHPIYIGGWSTTKNVSDTFSDPAQKGFRTRTGHFLRFSDVDGDLHIMIGKGDGEGGPSPAFVTIDKDGSLHATNEQGSMIYMNAKKPETSIITSDGEKTRSLLMLGDDKITLATASGGAIGIDGKDIVLTGDNVIADCNKGCALNAGSVSLGKGATEPAVKGMMLMQNLVVHAHPSPGFGIPVPQITPPPVLYKELSSVLKVA